MSRKWRMPEPSEEFLQELEKANDLRVALEGLLYDLEADINAADVCGIDLRFYARYMRKVANDLEAA